MLSDDRLAQRATRGDRQAFAAIYRRHHQGLYRFCLAILGNPQDAQDALQNTMVKVLRSLPGEERDVRLKPWLYRIAHNESVELLRRRRPTAQIDVEQAAPTAHLAETAETRERLRSLIADLEQLPERQRGALVMRELAGLSFEEIGAALGASGAVARQTVYEARLNVRQMEEGREMSCDAVTRALSDGDGRVARRRDIRAHLRTCESCRSFRDAVAGRRRDFAALAPLPAAASIGLLNGILGGHAGSSAGGLTGVLSGGAGKAALGGSALAKSAATVAVVAAVGISAADRSHLIHVFPPGGGGSPAARESRPLPAVGGSNVPADSNAAHRDGQAVRRAAVGAAAKAQRRHPGLRGAVDAGGRRGDGAAGTESSPGAMPPGAAAAHGHQPHAKTPPAAASAGQQTAASHGGGRSHGAAQAGSHGGAAHHGAPPRHGPSSHPSHPAPASQGAGKGAATQPAPASPSTPDPAGAIPAPTAGQGG
jgi:RNA polymerase sigma factor (sigma-70 family)